jgi:hypothetical protein
MPRPRKPTNLLELTGAFKNHPSRLAARAGEPIPTGPLGLVPRHWWAKVEDPDYGRCQQLCRIWKEIGKIAPWLTSGDRIAVELICVLLLKARQGGIRPGEMNVLKGLCNACGLDPSGRARIDTSAIGGKVAKLIDPRDAFAARIPSKSTDKPPA